MSPGKTFLGRFTFSLFALYVGAFPALPALAQTTTLSQTIETPSSTPIAVVLDSPSTTIGDGPAFEIEQQPLTLESVEPIPDAFLSTTASTTEIIGDETEDVKEEIASEQPTAAAGPAAPVEEVIEESDEAVSYRDLMLRLREIRTGEDRNRKALGPGYIQEIKEQTVRDLTAFIEAEEQRLDALGVSKEKKKAYFALLKKQLTDIGGYEPGFIEKVTNVVSKTAKAISQEVKDFFTWGDVDEKITDTHTGEEEEFAIPEHPARFAFDDSPVFVSTLRDATVQVSPGQKMIDALKGLVTVEEVGAVDDQFLPVIGDVEFDGAEVQVTKEMQDLVEILDKNPVKIHNYVSNLIQFEPYYGAKKGAIGCFTEKVCNDVDTASLTIALMRSAGIPARYKKSVAVMTDTQLQQLLGLEEVVETRRTLFGTFKKSQVPIFTLVGNHPDGEHIDDADFSEDNVFALEWTFVEIFYEYDERAGDVGNLLDISTASTTPELRDLVRDNVNRLWVPIDTLIKPYGRVQNEIVHDTANFDTESFWFNYLQYNGSDTPVDKYRNDLLNQTGKDIYDAQYQSVRTPIERTLEQLPPRTPYLLGSGTNDEITIEQEVWTVLPDDRRYRVRIQLLRDDDSSVFDHTFFASEINNVFTNVHYEGATQQDKDVINQYEGLHATPANLVDIKPYMMLDRGGAFERIDTNETVQIGDRLRTRFTAILMNENYYQDEKFSVAGNSEGMFVTLSRIHENPELDDTEDEYRYSKVFVEGNAAIAREYLKRIQEEGDLLEAVMDFEYNINFARAVVTQNRVLSVVDDVPTTFSFKGLSIDATTFLNDSSQRGNYRDHKEDFHLLWGLQASHAEADLFMASAGLDAVATVQGLQYAYQNPNDYTVHTITQDNESVIDTLNLSSNTKQNMHHDVQAGHTVVTPNGPIEKGTWRGIVYVSLAPDKTGTYAIGEQSQQNGGFTAGDVQVANFTDPDRDIEMYVYTFAQHLFDKWYGYQEGRSIADGISCTLTQTQHNAILQESGWNTTFGVPCIKKTKNFSGYQHVYILASNGAKFFSPNRYNYWVQRSVVADILDRDKTVRNHTDIRNIGLGGTFKFNFAAGTYSQYGSFTEAFFDSSKEVNYFCKRDMTMYYQPGVGFGNRLYGDFLCELTNNAGTFARLGFPTSNRDEAARSDRRKGEYQNFAGGQLYRSWKSHRQLGPIDGYDVTYPVFGTLATYYNNEGGSGGPLGFPLEEPDIDSNFIYQRFEDDQELEWNLQTNNVQTVGFRDYRCEQAGHISNRFHLKLIELEGLLDSAGDTLDDLDNLLADTGDAIVHPWRTTKEVKAIVDTLVKMDLEDYRNLIVQTATQEYRDALVEYDAAFGPNGCKARAAYLEGYLKGAVLQALIPATKIKLLTKLKILTRIKLRYRGLSFVSDMGTLGQKLRVTRTSDINQLAYIRSVPSTQKGTKGEEFWQRFVDGEHEPFPVDVPGLGDRNVDVWDKKNKIAYEIKNYASNVSASSFIRDQVAKDVHLMNTLKEYRPVWVFLDKGPTNTLRKLLEESGIDYTLITF